MGIQWDQTGIFAIISFLFEPPPSNFHKSCKMLFKVILSGVFDGMTLEFNYFAKILIFSPHAHSVYYGGDSARTKTDDPIKGARTDFLRRLSLTG